MRKYVFYILYVDTLNGVEKNYIASENYPKTGNFKIITKDEFFE